MPSGMPDVEGSWLGLRGSESEPWAVPGHARSGIYAGISYRPTSYRAARDRRRACLRRRRRRLPVGAGRRHGPVPLALPPRHARRPGFRSARVGSGLIAQQIGRRRVRRDRRAAIGRRVAVGPRGEAPPHPANVFRLASGRCGRCDPPAVRPGLIPQPVLLAILVALALALTVASPRPGRARTGRSPAERALAAVRLARHRARARAPGHRARPLGRPSLGAAAVPRTGCAPATRWLLHHELRARYRAGLPRPRGREPRNAGIIICPGASLDQKGLRKASVSFFALARKVYTNEVAELLLLFKAYLRVEIWHPAVWFNQLFHDPCHALRPWQVGIRHEIVS